VDGFAAYSWPRCRVDPEVARWGAPVPPMFRFRDPAGNSLTIVEPIE
jgi:hypothetical protein